MGHSAFCCNVDVHYLYQPGELEGGRHRSTDPIWSFKVYNTLLPLVKPIIGKAARNGVWAGTAACCSAQHYSSPSK